LINPPKPTNRTVPNSAERSNVVRLTFRGKPMAEAKALAFVRERLAKGGRFPSQDAIAERCSVAKSTVSAWMRKWEATGTIIRSRDGRCNVVSAGSALSA
jgi:DNA-binding transcriptional MocR family regulator